VKIRTPWDDDLAGKAKKKAKRKKVKRTTKKRKAKKKAARKPAAKKALPKKRTTKKRKAKKKARKSKKLPIAWGDSGSGMQWTGKGGEDDCSHWGWSKPKAKQWQEDLWDAGEIPDRPPRAWKVKRLVPSVSDVPVCMSAAQANKKLRRWKKLSNDKKDAERRAGKKPLPQEIPFKKYGDPDLAWFVDPDVAGDKAGKILVMFSGGKDSLAILLYVCEILELEYGLDYRDHVECWHQAVDGRPSFLGGDPSTSPPGRLRRGASRTYWREAKWDWPVTEDYCRAVCEKLGIPLYFGWREGGLQARLLRDNQPVGRRCYELPWLDSGKFTVEEFCAKGRGDKNTAWSFPAQSPDLRSRWCSSYAKIEVAERQMRERMGNDLEGKRILYVSGERAEESANRSKYVEREFYASWNPAANKKKGGWAGLHGLAGCHVEKWKPVHRWCELDVWAIIARWKIRPHPAYVAGWGRLSCMTCIFGSKDQWASIRKVDPNRFWQWVELEQRLIARRKKDMAKGVKNAKSRIVQVNANRVWTRKWTLQKIRREGVPSVAEYLKVDPEVLERFRKGKARVFKPTGDKRDLIMELLDHHGMIQVRYEEAIPEGALEDFYYGKKKTFVIDSSLEPLSLTGEPFLSLKKKPIERAMSTSFKDPVIMRNWKFDTPSGAPAGAFGEDYGPT
jgi:3'-phosphoadenosine 5'-phosphosulfate sulfotransferase (PAPS reductase)/FAD synthetase